METPIIANPVQVGDRMPEFTLPMVWHTESAPLRGEISLHSLRGQTVILYFYPEDDTPGCTQQACGYRDAAEDYKRLNASIYGVSADSLDSHAQFAAKYDLPFPLLADVGGLLRQRLGNPDGTTPLYRRITYIIDRDDIVRHIVNADGQAQVPDHLSQSYEWAARLAGADAAG